MLLFLLFLIFISKIALSFVPGMPFASGFFIFQAGLHPVMNVILNFLVGGLLLFLWIWKGNHQYTQSRFFRFYIFLTSLYLIFITMLQSLFVNTDTAWYLQMAAAFSAAFMMFLYGRVIPTSLNPERFIKIIHKIIIAFMWISLLLLFLSPATSFKGSRFIGVFKHIPHMVSAATLGCFTTYYYLFSMNLKRKDKMICWLNLSLSFFLLLLTGTRSAFAAVLMGLMLCLLVFKSRTDAARILKFSVALTGFLVMIFFGRDLADYSIKIVRGEESLGQRTAQDGLQTRWEEVERGFEIFKKDQWLGQGIISKFSNASDSEISGYDANKDPHNIIISAGVVGGWGFIFLCIAGFGALMVASLKSLFSKNNAIKILAIYLLTHLPILFIYHIHLSIGGIADRIYWIVFGYMAMKEADLSLTNKDSTN